MNLASISHLRSLLFFGLYISINLSIPSLLSADLIPAYRVTIEGVPDRGLYKLLEAISDTINLRERPATSLSLLERRVKKDIPRFLKALGSRGYYGAKVTWKIGKTDKTDQPHHVIFSVDTGPPYLLRSVDIQLLGEDTERTAMLPTLKEIGLGLDMPVRSRPILDGEQEILRWFRRHGFPFPGIAKRLVVVDHATKTASVTFQVESGPEAQFGPAEIIGLKTVDEGLVRNKIPWKQGERFNARLLGDARESIFEMGLFTSVHVKEAESVGRGGDLAVIIEVGERKHRTVKTGVSLKTDEGAGGRISWEHRNILGRGEMLGFSAVASSIALALEGNFKRPEFLRPDQALHLNMRLAEDRPDAFTSRNITSMASIERRLGKGMNASTGLSFRISDVEEFGLVERFHFISVPAQFDWDTTDTLFDPNRGGKLNLQLAPHYDILHWNLGFVKGYFRYSRYLQLSKKPDLILALRGVLGSIAGADFNDIPADTRFYAGGGGSIRGYAYQSVGPLREGESIGGRSLTGLTSELRIRFSNNLGFVVFLDGGSVFDSPIPDFKETTRWGAGTGFRYFTRIGPLRLDLGLPLNRREDIDDSFQIYVSLGQAF